MAALPSLDVLYNRAGRRAGDVPGWRVASTAGTRTLFISTPGLPHWPHERNGTFWYHGRHCQHHYCLLGWAKSSGCRAGGQSNPPPPFSNPPSSRKLSRRVGWVSPEGAAFPQPSVKENEFAPSGQDLTDCWAKTEKKIII